MTPLRLDVSGGVREVVTLGAHCDDVPIGAAGLLGLLAGARGDSGGLVVHHLVLSGGGGPREAEERAAMADAVPGADLRVQVLDLPDGRLPAHWGAAKQAVADLGAGADVQLVLAPHAADAHQDHRLVAEVARQVFRDRLHLGYEILKWESDLPTPGLLVPLTQEQAHAKAALLGAHYASQRGKPWFDAEAFLALMRVRGVQAGSRWAEGFVAPTVTLEIT